VIAIEDSGHTDMEHGLKAAALVRLKAAELCPGEGLTCFPYHGIRSYLRLFGMVSGPQRDAPFFLDALAAAAARTKPEQPRILISGSADDSIYMLVRQAVPDAAITVLDRCELPLYMCRRAAEVNSETVETIASDILDYTPSDDFHVICSDSFIAQFPTDRHGALIDIWRRALCPGGAVVTTTRIDPHTPPDGLIRSPTQIATFRDQILDRARPWRHMLDISLDEIAVLAERHGKLNRTHNLRSKKELTDLFENGGFRIERLDLTERSRSSRAISERDQSSFYADIVAVRL